MRISAIVGPWAMLATCALADDAYLEHAKRLMKETPLIDTHIDLPAIMRSLSTSP